MFEKLVDVKGVIFDLNFTLVGWREPMRQYEAMAQVIERPAAEIKQAARRFDRDYEIGLDPDERMTLLLQLLGAQTTSRLIKQLLQLESDETFRPTWLYPGVRRLLQNLRQSGFKLALCSNGNPNTVEIARRHGLLDATDGQVFSCRLGLRKPTAAIYAAAVRALKLKPQDCLYADDGGDRSLWGAKNYSPELLTVRVRHPESPVSRRHSGTAIKADFTVSAVAQIANLLQLPVLA